MKKRFTLMMMVLCILMSIPLKMMADEVTIHFVDEDGWGDYAAYVYDKTKANDGSNLVTVAWPGQVAAVTDIKEVNYKNGKKVKVVTWKINLKECASGNALVLFNNNKHNNVEKKYPSSVGWAVQDGLYYYKNGTTSTTPPSEGDDSGSGTTSPTISVKSNYGQDWGVNNKFNFSSTDGKIYTCELKDVPANETVYFRIVKNDKEWGPTSGSNLVLTSEYQKIYQVDNSSVSLQIGPSTVQSTYTITYDSENNLIKCTSTSGSGTGGGGGTTVDWNTVETNRLTEKKRVYTQGFYLAGDFFTFDKDKVDGKYKINYDDAVFKFQQQNDQSISTAAETPYDVYMVEIPASLNAHAQVMYVDETGKAVKVFGPTSACGISETYPTTEAKSTNWETLNGTEKFKENNNYWDFSTRNKPNKGYSDGLYEVYIAVDKNTHEPAKWMITHIADRRVAYFISDAPDATAIPLYDTYISDDQGGRFSNKFFATVNLATNRSYYVISNYVRDSGDVDKAQSYGAFNPNLHAISCPTTTKLFMLGNAAKDIALADDNNQFNQFSPNEEPMPGARSGMKQSVVIVEYNPSNGNRDNANLDKHFGIRGQVIVRSDRKELTSVSLVGDAIPGTTNADGTWNYKSDVADMTYDETEQCYKATVVTTVPDNGKSKFRFVGNRNQKITWFEDSNSDDNAMAKHPYDSDDTSVHGHTADANDPNKVNYTENGDPTSEDYNSWNIIWNRPAGRWTVRLYFYTTSDGNNPKTDYYYTITASSDMELYDIMDIVYGSETNKQNIHNKGEYKFLRTWSAKKTWKISNKVDVFVVNNVAEGESAVKLTLKKINKLDDTGNYNIIPAETGVILATTSAASEITGAYLVARQNYTSYNKLVIPMEENKSEYKYTDNDNLLNTIYYSKVIPASDENSFNYFFAYYNALIATKKTDLYGESDYLLGFWIPKGSKPYPGNSSYLQISKEKAATMNRLGTSYDDFVSGGTDGSAKKVPGIIFDFANVGGTTGINEVVNQSTKLNDGKYYTLSGQQVEKPTAGGIYIHNGRKFVVK